VARSICGAAAEAAGTGRAEVNVEEVIARLKALQVLDDRQYADATAEAQARATGGGTSASCATCCGSRWRARGAEGPSAKRIPAPMRFYKSNRFIGLKLRGQKPAEYLGRAENTWPLCTPPATAGFAAGPSIRVLNGSRRRPMNWRVWRILNSGRAAGRDGFRLPAPQPTRAAEFESVPRP